MLVKFTWVFFLHPALSVEEAWTKAAIFALPKEVLVQKEMELMLHSKSSLRLQAANTKTACSKGAGKFITLGCLVFFTFAGKK